MRGALTLAEEGDSGWEIPVLLVAAVPRQGLVELIDTIDRHRGWLAQDGRVAARRHGQAEFWLADAVKERFGRDGLKRAGDLRLAPGEAPFARLAEVAKRLGA